MDTGLLPPSGYHEQCSYDSLCTDFLILLFSSSWVRFQLSSVHTKSRIAGHRIILCFSFWGAFKLFQNSCTTFHICQRSSRVLISPQLHQHTLIFLFWKAILMGYEGISHSGSNLYFNEWCWTSFHRILGNLPIFFGPVFTHISLVVCLSVVEF